MEQTTKGRNLFVYKLKGFWMEVDLIQSRIHLFSKWTFFLKKNKE